MGMKGLTMAGLAQSVEHLTAEWEAQFLVMCQYSGSYNNREMEVLPFPCTRLDPHVAHLTTKTDIPISR